MNKSNCYDIIIIGAGPAGSTAAFILAGKGLNILVIDKHKFPRKKLCAGLLTWKTINTLEKIFKTDLNYLKSQGVINYQSEKYAIYNQKGELIRGKLEFPYHFVDRKIYDKFWLDKAREAGAKVLTGEKAVSFDIQNSKLETDRGNIYTKARMPCISRLSNYLFWIHPMGIYMVISRRRESNLRHMRPE